MLDRGPIVLGVQRNSALKRLPIGAIKIDRTFVDRLGDADDTAERSLLRELACDAVQGYLTGPPAPADALPAPPLG